MGYLYTLTSPSFKSYVGLTTRTMEERLKEHQEPASGCRAISNAIQKYGLENFVVDYYECPDDELNKHERWMVNLMGTLSPGGYNLREGGGSRGKLSDDTKERIAEAKRGIPLSEAHKQSIGKSQLGIPHTEETKKRISESLVGTIFTEERKQNISKSKIGIPLSEAHKQRISESLLGIKFTEEHKQKIGEPQRGEKHHSSKRVYQYDREGNFINSFGSSGEAARYLEKKYGNKIRDCARGVQKSAYGFIWSNTPPN